MRNYFIKNTFMYVCMLFICFSCSKDDEKATDSTSTFKKEIAKPKGVITTERATLLNDTWTRTRANIINSARTTGDNRSAWWSLEDIRNYLDYAESECNNLGYNMDGIRVYFGAYPEDEANENAGQATLFFVPTGTASFAKAGSMLNLLPPDSGDVPNGPPLNGGGPGMPPPAEYPQ